MRSPSRKQLPKTAKAQIEAVVKRAMQKHGQLVEYGFYRSKPGILRNATLSAKARSADIKPPKARDRSELHVHTDPTTYFSNQSGSAAPSILDFHSMIGMIRSQRKPKLRTFHIASTDAKGNVTGYYTMRLSPELMKMIHNQKNEKIHALLHQIEEWEGPNARDRGSLNYTTERLKTYHKIFQQLINLGMRVRTTPMPGYVFRDYYFIRKRWWRRTFTPAPQKKVA